jgi:hypothetical protein
VVTNGTFGWTHTAADAATRGKALSRCDARSQNPLGSGASTAGADPSPRLARLEAATAERPLSVVATSQIERVEQKFERLF